jgi:hypothetical protein
MAGKVYGIDELKRILPTVRIDDETYYVAETDVLLDEAQLAEYAAASRALPPELEDKPHEALAVLKAGKIVRWKPGLELSYFVARATFTDDEYVKVKGYMMQATRDWQDACGVRFAHKDGLDGVASPSGAVFAVRKEDSGGRFIAAAFYPHDAKKRRHMLIDPGYFNTRFDRVGVLRHELGHVLGLRHEHIRKEAPPTCPGEDVGNTLALSLYDPKSVMHYLCAGIENPRLEISDTDRIAAQRLYGPPLGRVIDVE